eukprot:gene3065-3833_t
MDQHMNIVDIINTRIRDEQQQQQQQQLKNEIEGEDQQQLNEFLIKITSNLRNLKIGENSSINLVPRFTEYLKPDSLLHLTILNRKLKDMLPSLVPYCHQLKSLKIILHDGSNQQQQQQQQQSIENEWTIFLRDVINVAPELTDLSIHNIQLNWDWLLENKRLFSKINRYSLDSQMDGFKQGDWDKLSEEFEFNSLYIHPSSEIYGTKDRNLYDCSMIRRLKVNDNLQADSHVFKASDIGYRNLCNLESLEIRSEQNNKFLNTMWFFDMLKMNSNTLVRVSVQMAFQHSKALDLDDQYLNAFKTLIKLPSIKTLDIYCGLYVLDFDHSVYQPLQSPSSSGKYYHCKAISNLSKTNPKALNGVLNPVKTTVKPTEKLPYNPMGLETEVTTTTTSNHNNLNERLNQIRYRSKYEGYTPLMTDTISNLVIDHLKGCTTKSYIDYLFNEGAIYIRQPLWNIKTAIPRPHRVFQDQSVDEGSLIKVYFSPRTYPTDHIDLDKIIVHENDHFILVDKPHAVSMGPIIDSYTNNLAIMYVNQRKQQNTTTPLNVLYNPHRLDFPTRGLCLLVKDHQFLREFNKLIMNRQVNKIYKAIVPITKENKDKELPIGLIRHFMKPTNMAPKIVTTEEVEGWHECLLNILSVQDVEYKIPLEDFDERSFDFIHQRYNIKDQECLDRIGVGSDRNRSKVLKFKEVEIQLLTGRTHQIRAQFSSLGFPLLSDPMYGGLRLQSLLSEEDNLQPDDHYYSSVNSTGSGFFEDYESPSMIGLVSNQLEFKCPISNDTNYFFKLK